MAINWDDNHKRKAFSEALKDCFTGGDDLEMFVDHELNLNLYQITGSGIPYEQVVYKLIKWAIAKGKIEALYKAFCDKFSDNPVIAILEQPPLIQKTRTVPDAEWDSLFVNFDGISQEDILRIKLSFLEAFRLTFNCTFEKIQPKIKLLDDINQFKDLMGEYDEPLMALRFVELCISQLGRSNSDLTSVLNDLEKWRDKFAAKHSLLVETLSVETKEQAAYLLVSIKESGQRINDNPSVMVFTELWVTGEENPIEFNAESFKCAFNEVAEKLSDLIVRAESVLLPYGAGRVTLELFMPCVYLEENVFTWEVMNEQGSPRFLGLHRAFMVRSLERAINPVIKSVLKKKWLQLKQCIASQQGCIEFLTHESCPTPGILSALLDQKTGLKLVAELPADSRQREEVLFDIINAAIPISLWSNETEASTPQSRLLAFDEILDDNCLMNFAMLAQKWREQRTGSQDIAIQNLRLMCDCPDRMPSLPDSSQEEDFLVAS